MLLRWHIAETREGARAEARDGLMRHHNEYIAGTLQRPGARPFKTPDEAVDKTAFSQGPCPRSVHRTISSNGSKSVLELSGGFGTVVGFVHDWANPENTMRIWDMVARYVVPVINGFLAGLRKSQDFVNNNRAVFARLLATFGSLLPLELVMEPIAIRSHQPHCRRWEMDRQ